MPVSFLEETPTDLMPRMQTPTPELEPKPPIGKTIAAAFETSNTLGSAIASGVFKQGGLMMDPQPPPPIDESYDPFVDIKGYEPFASSFVEARNPEHVAAIKQRIDREQENRQTLDAAGWQGMVATLAAGALDPLLLPMLAIPGGIEVKAAMAFNAARAVSPEAAGAVAKIAASAISPLEMAGRFATYGAAGVAAQESVLHATQETRTLMESVYNVGGATLLSGVLGAAAGRLTRAEFTRLAKVVDEDISAGIREDAIVRGVPGAGAEATRKTTLAEETMVGTGGVAQITQNVNPLLRVMHSPSVTARQIVQDLVESPFITEKNLTGIANPVAIETRIKQHDARLGAAFENLDQLFVNYRTGAESGGFLAKTGIAARDVAGRDKMNFKEFREAVGEAMRNNDMHAVPQVQAAAQQFRKLLFDPHKEEAIALGLLPEGVKAPGADSYLTRVYKHDVIKERRPEFREIITRWLEAGQLGAAKQSARLEGELSKLLTPEQSQQFFGDIEALGKQAGAFKRAGMIGEEANIRAQVADLTKLLNLDAKTEKALKKALEDVNVFMGHDRIELQSIADEVINNILGHPSGLIPRDIVPIAGPLKERTLTIPDAWIKDFLESDIELIGRYYNRTMGPEIELTRTFGDADMHVQVEQITNEYDLLQQAAKTPKERKALAQAKEEDLRDLLAMRDILTGRYAAPVDPDSFFVRAGRDIRKINFLSMLGGMTISSISDLARPVMVHGLAAYGEALKQLAFSPRVFKLATKEVKEAGAAWDMVLNSRANALADIGDLYGLANRVERGLKRASDTFGVVSLQSPWNAGMKQFAGVMTQTRLLEGALEAAAGRAHIGTITRLARSGIDASMASRIAKQFNEFGDQGDVLLSGAAHWTDKEAAGVLRGAILKDVDIIINTPGAGDRPLWMSTELGKLIGQFKSFSFASHNRTFLAGLQQRDAATLNGLLYSVALGAVIYGLKQAGGGREISDDPAVLIREAVDRSGVTGFLFDAHNIIEKATRGGVGLAALGSGPQMSRYASRNALGALFGPTVGTAQDIAQVIGAAGSGDVKQSDTHAIRKLLPYQNLFYLRNLIDVAEENVNEQLGISK